MNSFSELRSKLDEQIQLIEGRLTFTKNQYASGINTSHDPEAKHTTPEKVVDYLAKNADPTEGNTHLGWIASKYNRGDFKQSDVKDVKKTLTNFEALKKHLPNKDINSYNSLSDIKDTIVPHLPKLKATANSTKTSSVEGHGLHQEYDNEGVKGFSIPSQELSVKNYGSGGKLAKTSWCTAANSSNNMFDSYTSGGNKLHTIHLPSGEAMQFSHAKGEFRDVGNRAKSPSDFGKYEPHIREYVTQSDPKHKDVPSSLSETHGKFGVDAANQHISKAYDRHKEFYNHNRNEGSSHEQALRATKQFALGRSTEHKISNLASTMPMSDEHFSKLHEMGFQNELSKNPNLKSHHIDKLLGE